MSSTFTYLFVTLSPLLILSFTLLLHYHQHFKLKLCAQFQRRQPKLTMNVSKDRVQRECRLPRPHCCTGCVSLIPKDEGEQYNFFPISFFYLIILKIIICAFIVLLDVMNYIPNHIFFTHWSDSPSVHVHKPQKLFVILSSYILIYSVMLFSIWESLFSFYKYYTTYKVVTSVEIVSTAPVLMRFMIYASVFALLFSIQIHLWYYLWILVLFVHTVFNFVCVLKFSSILIEKYHVLSAIDECIDNGNANVIDSVYVMRRISILCNVVHTAALALFTISYCVHTIYYLPLFWSLSTAIYSFNFVRNRKYLIWKAFTCAQKLKYCSVFAHARNENRKSGTEKANAGNAIEVKVMDPPTTIIKAKFSDIVTAIDGKSESTENTVKSPDTYTVSSLVSNEPSGPHVRFAVDVHISTYTPAKQRVPTGIAKKPTDKALHILGIQSCSTSPRIFPKLNAMVKSQSSNISSPTISEKIGSLPPAMKITYSQSDIATRNAAQSNLEDIDKHETEREESISEVSKSYLRRVPLRRLSSPSMPVMPHEWTNMKDANDLVDIELHGAMIEEEDECVFVDYDNDGQAMEIEGMDFNDAPPQLKHQKSSSNPVVINDILQNVSLVQVMDSLDLFAKYGFCSRNNINSLYQLTRYREKIQPITIQSNK